MRARSLLVFFSLAALAFAPACSSEPEKRDMSAVPLAERLGGNDAMERVIKDCVEDCETRDARVSGYVARVGTARVEQELLGRIEDRSTTDPGLPAMKPGEADAFFSVLSHCLYKNGLGERERTDVMAKLEPLRKELTGEAPGSAGP